jgi:hypothetical protein
MVPDDDVLDLTDKLRAIDDDPPPAALLAAARAAFSWRTVDTELCRPSYDSLLDEALTPTRGDQDGRLLRFDFDELALDVEVSTAEGRRTLVGQLTPAVPAELTVRHGGAAELSARADELGRFTADDVRPGPLSIRCVVAGHEAAVHTDWVLI